MASDCIFCRIAAGTASCDRVYEDEDILAFRDIHPAAEVHVLVIPKRHVPTLNEFGPDDAPLLGRLLLAAAEVARLEGVAGPGYRTAIHVNAGGGQEVYHLHVHVMGGRRLR